MISFKKNGNFQQPCDLKSHLNIGQLLNHKSPLFSNGTPWNLQQDIRLGFPNKYSINLII